MAAGRLSLLRSLTPWALLALLGAEFALFDQEGARHHSWIYPRWNDQVQYLTECYTGWEFMRAHGFWRGLWQTLVNPSAQGTLHDFAGVIAFTVAGGPSRSALLALNMLALIAWQAALFFAVGRTAGSRSLAWAAAALPLTLAWPWNGWAGSMADFRLDHFAMCAFGITLAVALLNDGFRSTRWSLAFGATVGVTLLTRFLTGTYFALIFPTCLVWVLCSPDRGRRAGNLAVAALVAFALAAPIFWLNREWVWNYYWIGHFTGPESAIRSPHMNLTHSVDFIWTHFSRDHLGPAFWRVAGAGSVVLAALAFVPRKRPAERESASAGLGAPRDWLFFGTVFLLAPALVLTLHSQKSEIVLGVLVPGAFVIVLALWSALQRRATTRSPIQAHRALNFGVAAGIVAFASWHFVARQFAPPLDDDHADDLRSINRLADRVFASANAGKLTRPWVGVNQISTGLDALVLSVICYERHKTWVPFAMTLPTGIMEADEKLIMERVALSDFLFLVVDGPVSDWPFDQQQRRLLPKVRAWCEANRHAVERYEIFGQRMVLYQRREIPFASGRP